VLTAHVLVLPRAHVLVLCRSFLADLFSQTEAHYSFKQKKKDIKEQIKMMEHLRDEAELEEFKTKQRKRSSQENEEAAGKRFKTRE